MTSDQILGLFREFIQTYDEEEKDAIWQNQSITFRDFWANKVINPSYGELIDSELHDGRFCCFLSLRVVQIVFSNVQSGGIELCGQNSDIIPHIENCLMGRRCRGSELPVVTLIPEPQGALEAGQEP